MSAIDLLAHRVDRAERRARRLAFVAKEYKRCRNELVESLYGDRFDAGVENGMKLERTRIVAALWAEVQRLTALRNNTLQCDNGAASGEYVRLNNQAYAMAAFASKLQKGEFANKLEGGEL